MSLISADQAIDYGTLLVTAGQQAKAAGLDTVDLVAVTNGKFKAAEAEVLADGLQIPDSTG